jgi:hypothetical protein
MEWNNITASYKKNYLPSKKIIITLFLVIAAGFLYWAIPKIKQYSQTNRLSISLTGKPPEPLIATTPSPTSFDKDTDGDGIPDWQENLFGFDPTKKDTNGDGIPDALPTANGQSVGDLIKLPTIDKLTLAVYEKYQDTPTDKIDPNDVQATAGNAVLAQAQSIEDGLKKYQQVDLNLGDSDKASILAYQTAINNIVASVPDGAVFAKNIQEKLLKGTNPATFETNFLNQTVTKLLNMPVPTRLSDFHLKLLNGAYYLIQVLQMPQSSDELNTYTLSLVAQKNINLISQTVSDINKIADIYKTYE